MAWEDRLAEAAYTSPSGVRIVFDYEDVSRSVDKKTTAFDFPDANGSYVQDLGHRGREYPLRVIFSGENCDLAGAAFFEILLEVGLGRLEHPAYGVVDVVPAGKISQRDDLKTAANQSIIEVTFWESTGIIYPTSQDDPAAAVARAVDAYNAAMAEQQEKSLSLRTVAEKIGFKSQYLDMLKKAKTALGDVAKAQQDVRQQFDGIVTSINLGIDILVAAPLNLAFQTALLIEAPAQALTDITARLTAYADLATAIITTGGVAVPTGHDNRSENAFHGRDLFASSAVVGSVASVLNAQFETKPAALAAATVVLDLLDTVVTWRETNYASVAQIDTGEAYQQMQTAVALTAGYLVALSFSLKQERRVVLTRPRSCIDLVAELYGSVDDVLDFFINSNELTGAEILELPRGRAIVYYV